MTNAPAVDGSAAEHHRGSEDRPFAQQVLADFGRYVRRRITAVTTGITGVIALLAVVLAFGTGERDIVTPVLIFAGFLLASLTAAILGVTFKPADVASQPGATRSHRVRAYVAAALAVALGSLTIAALFLGALGVVGWIIDLRRDDTGQGELGLVIRSIFLVMLIGVGGFGLRQLTKSRVVFIVVVVGYIPLRYAIDSVANSYGWPFWPVNAIGAFLVPRETILLGSWDPWWLSGVYLAVLSLAIVALGAVRFVRAKKA